MKKLDLPAVLVDINGDEMAQVMWTAIKSKILEPFLNLTKLQSYDLSLPVREHSKDQITLDAAAAIKKHKIAVKCATITPNTARVEEYKLTKMWKSPNGTIRNELDGTIFRKPIIIPKIQRSIPHWNEPIIIARHAFADQYKAREIAVPVAGKLKLVFQPSTAGTRAEYDVHTFTGPGVALAMFNTDASIYNFARSVLNFGLAENLPVFLSLKETILQVYDGRFKDIFTEVYQNEFKTRYEKQELSFSIRLIDDMLAYAIGSNGGFLWALKNYDGDVQSDMLARGYGSLGLMSSILMGADGESCLAEAAHGTVTDHYRLWQAGEETSTNPIASIFAWTKALNIMGKQQHSLELQSLAQNIELAIGNIVSNGIITSDLVPLVADQEQAVSMNEFLDSLYTEIKSLQEK